MKPVFWGLLFCIFLRSAFAPAASLSPRAFLEGKNLETGATVSLPPANKKALVLIFLSIACPNSQAHQDEIKKLAEKYQDFAFVGVHSNADESIENSRRYFKKQSLPFLILQDEGGILADRFKALKTPQAYVLAVNGSLLYQGGVTDSAKPESAHQFFLQNALDDIKNERPVRVPEGRALGCVISRSKESSHVW